MNTEELGQRIAAIRKQKGITQEELAAKASINVRTIQRIEKGEVDPRSYTVNLIAEALDISLDELVPKEDSGESRLWVLLLHASNYIPLLVIPVVIYFWKKDDFQAVAEHGKIVLNFQFTMFFALMIAGFLSIFIIGIVLAPIIGIFMWVTTTINIARYVGGHPVRYPFTMNLLK